jgi:hypothetical protein
MKSYLNPKYIDFRHLKCFTDRVDANNLNIIALSFLNSVKMNEND